MAQQTFTEMLTPEFLIGYTLLSVYAAGIQIYDEAKSEPVLTKWNIVKIILISFTPFNVIVALVWTIFELILGNLYRYTHKNEEVKKHKEEERKDYIFGFMKYKGIEMSELDEYIESRNMMNKMLDKIN